MSISPTEVQAIEDEGLVLVGQAQDMTITDPGSFQQAGAFLRSIKLYQKRVHDIFDPIVQAANLAHKTAVAQRSKMLAGADEAEGVIKRALAQYETAQRAAREAIQRAQETAARAVAVAAREEQARALEAQGSAQAAATVRAAPPAPVILPPTPPIPRAEGVGFVDRYSAVVIDLSALVKAVAAGEQALDLLQPNMTALHGLARSLKDGLRIPGVEVKKERGVAASA
jgi:hypothetical protein